ncbi:hypothetical protein [Dyadobacter arcticus]|uniref:Uncharacterized protein n=1 Tax=Dyadobacter arcticus TaxID=1078754 RepID=A0ABX0UHT3_9BACT|nr:hypothetical protein [Dyadobacter arcticus]NIJ52583.1 hypothetical protein [Dyadobacter arcticus]
MLLKGELFKPGCWGGIVFSLAVAPIGSYVAFQQPFLWLSLCFSFKEDLIVGTCGSRNQEKLLCGFGAGFTASHRQRRGTPRLQLSLLVRPNAVMPIQPSV